MDKNIVRLGLVQMGMGEAAQDNLSKALNIVEKCSKQGAQIVCLPELFTAPYFAQEENRKSDAANFAQAIPGKATDALSLAAKENGIAIIGGSIYEKDEKSGRFYNTSCVFDSTGRMLGKYRKIHIPHDQCYFEQDYFEPGDLGFKVFEVGIGGAEKTRKIKIAPLICYDQWFPEAARAVALEGTELIFYPTAIATVRGIEQAEGNWQEAWENVMRGHAIANGVIVAGVNRCGSEGRMDFWGGSFVCDAFGKTLARAGGKEEAMVVKVDLSHSEKVREGWRFMKCRRPDQYKKILESAKG